MDPNTALAYRHHRSPSSDLFFSPPSDVSSAVDTAGDELHEIDVFYTSDFSASEEQSRRSNTVDHRFHQSIRRQEKFGILAALPERERKIDAIFQKPVVCSPPAASFARDIPAIPKPHSSSEAKYTQSMPGRRFQQSAPINVPIMPIRARNDELADVDDELLPPHEMVARVSLSNQKTTFSVLEGVGRTLKGRDLRQVRNAVWRQTGFLD